jgi:hypothetical protein
MKKLIIAALLVFGIAAFAQERKEMGKRLDRRPEMEKFSPEQRTQLMVKKMTLELDLNTKQQEQVKQIIVEKIAKFEAMKAEHKAKKEDEKRPTVEEQFTQRNKMLDEQIAMKNNMKSILSTEQFEKWNKLKDKFQKRQGGRKNKNEHEREHDDK